MKTMKSDETNRSILKLLRAHPMGMLTMEISKELNMNFNVVMMRLRRMYSKGYVTQKYKFWKLLPQGELWYLNGVMENARLIKEPVNSNSINQPVPHPKPPIDISRTIVGRAHKFGMEYSLIMPMNPKDTSLIMNIGGIGGKVIGLNNNKQVQVRIETITLRVTTRSLLLYTKDLYVDAAIPTIDLESAMKPIFDEKAELWESYLRGNWKKLNRHDPINPIKLLRIGPALVSKIISQHYAEEHHPFVENREEGNRVLARSPIDGQRRLGWDSSKGFREMEYYHSTTANVDKDEADAQFNGLLDGKISLWDIPRTLEILGTFMQEVRADREADREFREQIKLHLGVMHKIDKKISQKVLKDYDNKV